MELAEVDQKLTKDQKQAVGILSIGTFLEYFDLMLYVHMAVLLNDLFFSKTDSFSASLLSAFSFCATFVFRPLGALLIGWLGDTYGRKSTIVLTSFLMAGSCIAMASLPTYEKLGITASIAVTLCRVLQGMSSMGERVGSEVYLTELIKLPKSCHVVCFVCIFATLGGFAALLIANISLSQSSTWRSAFWFGAIVAVIGIFARKCLRETPDFADAKRKMIAMSKDFGVNKEEVLSKPWFKKKNNKKTLISFFLILLATPIYFYFTYIHCADILKNKIGYSYEAIIQHNLIVSLIDVFVTIIITYLVSFIHPFKIMRIRFYLAVPFILACPFLLNYVSNASELMMIQLGFVILPPTEFSATPIFYKSFPIFKRFTTACFTYALSRALMYVVSSFGIVYLIKYFGNLGLLFLLVPIIVGYGYGLFYFIRLNNQQEKEMSTSENDISLKDALLGVKRV